MEERGRGLRLYGRQVGHGGLRPSHQAAFERIYPTLRLDDKGHCLDVSDIGETVWLEIGFGSGEHLLWQAEHNTDVQMIGVEPFQTGVAKCLLGCEARGLDNVRLCAGDGRSFVERFPDESVERVFVLHPDPWPKWRHAKRRLIQPQFLNSLSRILRPGGELRIGTDWPDYSCWALRHLLVHPAFEWRAKTAQDWQGRPQDWPETRYAVKAKKEGRRDVHLSFVRRAR